ncbi:MAG: DUF3429 domain-containing protein [Acetobacterales bacterium]
MAGRSDAVPAWAQWLGWLGVIPFVAGALAALVLPDGVAIVSLSAVLAYGAVVLSYLGGVRWGLAMAEYGGSPGPMTWVNAIVPPTVGWLANLMALAPGLTLLTLAYVAAFFFDLAMVRAGQAPAWYAALRRPLSAVTVASLGVCLLAVFVRFS